MRDRNDHMDRKRWIVGLVVVGMVGCMNEKLYLRMLYNNVDGYIWVLCFFFFVFWGGELLTKYIKFRKKNTD